MRKKAHRPRSNGPGKGKTSVSTSIPLEIGAKLRETAAKGSVSTGTLARAYIIQGVNSGRFIKNVWTAEWVEQQD